MSDDSVSSQEHAAWLEVTIDRPAALNALNAEILDGLAAATAELRTNDDLRGMILTGSGEKAFVAGADISGLIGLGPAGALAFSQRGQAVFDAIERGGKPVIAAVNGWALGGGCELALASHIRVTAKTAKFGLPEVSLGVIPGYGGTQRLARLVGTGRALQMILIGDPIDAEEAYRIGLANLVVEQTDLLEACRKLAARITSRGPWYQYSWKGAEDRSGGLATNIGIHFFDLLMWIFGDAVASSVHWSDRHRMSGYLELHRATVRWYLSIAREDLPEQAVTQKKSTFRSITVDNREVEFSEGFTDLHTRVYEGVLQGKGFGITEARPSIELVHALRTTPVNQEKTLCHPFLLKRPGV